MVDICIKVLIKRFVQLFPSIARADDSKVVRIRAVLEDIWEDVGVL